MKLSDELMQRINDKVYMVSGMSYEEFSRLDNDRQQEIIRDYHMKKKSLKKDKTCLVMIGSGENATFVRVKRGKKVMLSDGTVVRAGITRDEYRERQDKRLNKIINENNGVKERVLRIFKRKRS